MLKFFSDWIAPVAQSKKEIIGGIAVIAVTASGLWIYENYFRSLGAGIQSSVASCILKNRPATWCNPQWNPTKSANPKDEVRARVAAIGYKSQILNGTTFLELDFSPSGQRKAERYAWKLYGGDWEGKKEGYVSLDGQKKNKPFLGIDFSKTEQRRYGNIYNLEWGSPRHNNARENRRDVLRECNSVVRNKGLIPISGEELNAMLDAGAKIITGTDLKIRVSAIFYDEDGTVNRLMTDNENYIPGTCYVNETVVEGKASVLK